MTNSESKYKGALVLSAIGDSLGWITEFERFPASIKKKYGTEAIETFCDWEKTVGGRFLGYIDRIRAGSYSDDTQLMLALSRCVTRSGRVDNIRFSKVELPCWLGYARGGGRTVKEASAKIMRKSARWNNNFFTYKIKNEKVDYRQTGANGAAMRVLPIALVNLGDIQKTNEEIFSNSIVTHGHPRALLGALVYGNAIQEFIVRDPGLIEPLEVITKIGVDFQKKFELSFADSSEVKDWLKVWDSSAPIPFSKVYAETIGETQGLLRTIYSALRDKSDPFVILKKLGCFDPNTRGSGTSTVAAGIFLAAKYCDRPREGVKVAVNAVGSDTDSIAAFTGGLLGALHGLGGVPTAWKRVQDHDLLTQTASRLLAISEDRFVEQTEVEQNNIEGKILDSITNDEYRVGDRVFSTAIGCGAVTSVNRQKTVTSGKYNLLVEICFDSGQTCVFSALLSTDQYPEDRLSG